METARQIEPEILLPQSERNALLPIVALLSAALLWGGSFPAMRIAVSALNPWSVMWLRMTTAFVILAPFVGKSTVKSYRKGDWKRLLPMVLFQPCLYFLFESYALKFTTPSQAGIISSLVPLFVACGAWFFLKEAIGRNVIIGLFATICGVVGLTLLGGANGQATRPVLGNGLELVAMVCAAINMVMVKGLSERYSPWTLTAMQIFTGSLFFLPGLWPLMTAGTSVWTMELVASMVFLGAFVTVCAFGLYNWGMSHVPASRAAIFINLVPVNAVVLGWVLLGESLGTGQLLMGVLVLGGVVFSQRG